MSNSRKQKAIDAIREVEDKADLREISAALKEQFDRVQRDEVDAFRVGDEVVATADSKFAGLRGRVLRVNKKTVSVEPIDADDPKLAAADYVRFSPGYLRKA